MAYTENAQRLELADVPTTVLPDATHIEVVLRYSKGGVNLFTGNPHPRGYVLAFNPVTVKVEGAFTSKSFVMFSNGSMAFVLAGATRFNAKKLAAFRAALEPHITELTALFEVDPMAVTTRLRELVAGL